VTLSTHIHAFAHPASSPQLKKPSEAGFFWRSAGGGVAFAGVHMTKRLLAAIAVVAWSVPALAADIPVKAPLHKAPAVTPAVNWNGWYVGGHVGYLWGRTTVWDDGVLIESNAKTDGVVGGLLGGINWQTGAWVFGLEADFGWSNARGTGGAALPTIEVNHYDINWTGHFRGRVGYAVNNLLLFIAGGLALADIDYSQTSVVAPVTAPVDGAVYTGWSIGGGVDVIISPKVIGRAEYLYDDYGHKNYVIIGDPYRVAVTGQTFRAALIFKP
jgi:outer membrane immunogenic protein